MIKVDNVCFYAKNKMILENISFSVNSGECIALTGPNGAGKTTLMKILNGFIKADTGNVTLYNKNILEYKKREKAKLISYVPQNSYTFMSDFTALEYTSAGRYPFTSFFNTLTKDDMDKVYYYMNITNTYHLKDINISKLSGGEMQRVNIAAALSQEAKIMMMDEPASFLDPKTKHDIYSLLDKLNRDEKITLIIITHDINYAAMLNSKFLCLKNGKIFKFENKDKVISDKIFNELYNMDFEYINYNNTVKIEPKWKKILR